MAPDDDFAVADAMLDFLCGSGDEPAPEWVDCVLQCDPERPR